MVLRAVLVVIGTGARKSTPAAGADDVAGANFRNLPKIFAAQQASPSSPAASVASSLSYA